MRRFRRLYWTTLLPVTESVGMVLENDTTAQIELAVSLFYPLKVGDAICPSSSRRMEVPLIYIPRKLVYSPLLLSISLARSGRGTMN
jgi:hypothetical protein